MNFGSDLYRLGRLKEKQRDISFRNKHRREVVTLRSFKRRLKTCGGKKGYRWRGGWMGLSCLDVSSKGKRLYRPEIDPRHSEFQPLYLRHSTDLTYVLNTFSTPP
jgi:hypothetical protein